MRRIFFVGFLFLPWSVVQARPAETPATGFGIIVAGPNGFSLKHFLSANTAIDGALAWDIGDVLYVHTDYLFKSRVLKQEGKALLTAHYGLGARVQYYGDKGDDDHNHDQDDEVGLRAPIGLDIFFPKIPLEFFAEVAAVMDFLESTRLSVNVGIGGRFYF